jgi:hypothetical protein
MATATPFLEGFRGSRLWGVGVWSERTTRMETGWACEAVRDEVLGFSLVEGILLPGWRKAGVWAVLGMQPGVLSVRVLPDLGERTRGLPPSEAGLEVGRGPNCGVGD